MIKQNKKSQTELLGIAIVVVIISIGLLLIISNAMKKSKTIDQKREFSEKQMATNILGALLYTTTNCNNEKIGDLLVECGKCQNSGTCPKCGGEGAEGGIEIPLMGVCDYVSIITDNILNKTLKVWNKKYQFMVYRQSGSPGGNINPYINITHNISQCLESSSYIQKDFYYLPLNPETLNVELSLCS